MAWMVTALRKTIQTFCDLYELGVPSYSRYSSRSAQVHCLLGLPDTDMIPRSITPTRPLVASMMSQCKVLIAFTFALLSKSILYLRPCADVSTRYIRQIPMAYTTVCLSASEHGERIALVNWISGVQWVAPRCSRISFFKPDYLAGAEKC
ncbi:unnamed protein product [Penicillium nalgiovense]|nr:unnamed protein product [Penicillium nalgiovense]